MSAKKTIIVTKSEEKIINLWRNLQYGEMIIKIQDGHPQNVVGIKKRVDLKKIAS